MRALPRLAVALALAGWSTASVHADVVFPARLDVAETEPGQYAITFDLPMVNGRVLRAEPAMPPTCRDISERERTAGVSGVTTTWSVVCDPASLAGEVILVQGLLGTQIELAFTLTTVDGRAFDEILKPSRPGFLVPLPPTATELAATAGVEGVRWVLSRVELWLLMLVAALTGARSRELARGTAAFAVGVAVAQWLVEWGWLAVSLPVSEAFVLLTAAVPAVRLAGGGERWQGWIRPLWPVMLLVGALAAGAGSAETAAAGLSRGEQIAALCLLAAGAAVGMGWLSLVAVELRAVLALIADGRWRERAPRVLGSVLGVLAVGALLARVVALGVLAVDFPRDALHPMVVAVALAPLLVAAGGGGRWTMPAFLASACLGLGLGLARIQMPLGEVVSAALLLVVALVLVSARPLPRPWSWAVAAPGAAACTWWGTLTLAENVSRSTGAAAATVLVAAALLYAGTGLFRGLEQTASSLSVRLVGAAVAAWVVIDRLAAYRSWFEHEVATTAALGLLRVPVAALVLVAVAGVVWPRRRRVLDELGVSQRRRAWHWAALAAAFLAIPYGTLTVPNPLHQPHAPRGGDARRVASSVLLDTYRAFNLTDEEEVFDRLAENVTADLVDDLYLDSRRRLTAGTREGTEVTVREVSVLEIGDPAEQLAGSGSFAYDCRWVVTARVRHLQHVHHRRNIYGGVLTLTADGDRWKIAGIELTSEDRVVLWSQPT